MTADGELERSLHRAGARAAGVVCAALALLGAAVLGALMFAWRDAGAVVLAYLGAWAALWVLMAVAGVQLLRGNAGAQRLLLVFWLLVAVVTALAALTGGLRGVGWWTLPVPLWLAASVTLVGAVVCVALLMAASAERSPQRCASTVTVSVAVALALAIVVNLIGQDPEFRVRRDVQQLGQYGLSGRTRTVLARVQSPVRLTCVYTSTDERARGEDYRPAVLELLEDMHEVNGHIEVGNAATESAKAAVVARLRDRVGGRADKHVQFLAGFAQSGKNLTAALSDEQARWSAMGEDSYLSMWALTAQVPTGLGKVAGDVEAVRAKVERELAGSGLPDYAGLADEVKGVLESLKHDLESESKLLTAIGTIPPAAAANRKKATERLEAMRKAVMDLKGALADERISQASPAVLDNVAALARDATDKAIAAAKALQQIGGEKNARIVAASRYYQLSIPSGVLEVRADLGRLIEQYVAGQLRSMAETVEAIRKVAKVEYYGSSVAKLQGEAGELAGFVQQITTASLKALDRLAEVDEPSGALLALAQAGQAFQGPLAVLSPLLEEAGLLPELTGDSVAADIVGDNIVIIEAEATGKTAVVPFDEVWPLRQQAGGEVEAEGGPRPRTFQGDSAIAARIVAMTEEPEATVLITYYGGGGPEARMAPRPDIPPTALAALRKRLSEANFEVKDWNLDEERPAATPGRPQVLLVLPPAPALPGLTPRGEGFGEQHVAKVAGAIDAGTPAIFLAVFSWPRQMLFAPPVSPPYGFGEYLRTGWGIDVKTDYLVIPALADETQPGLYRLAPARFAFVPLSAFTSQAIGKPLQAQRVLWTALSPVLTAGAVPAGVRVEPVLEVPAEWRSTWATRRLMDLQSQLESQGATIRPDYAAGDIPPPFAVAVAATRSGRGAAAATVPSTSSAPSTAEAAGPSRIVVMTLGAGMVDGYLDQQVGQLDARNTLEFSDPPRANAEVVVNSVYWLVGREAMISAGPSRIRPVAMIAPEVMNLLRAVYLIGLPAAVAVIGAAVLLARRR